MGMGANEARERRLLCAYVLFVFPRMCVFVPRFCILHKRARGGAGNLNSIACGSLQHRVCMIFSFFYICRVLCSVPACLTE